MFFFFFSERLSVLSWPLPCLHAPYAEFTDHLELYHTECHILPLPVLVSMLVWVQFLKIIIIYFIFTNMRSNLKFTKYLSETCGCSISVSRLEKEASCWLLLFLFFPIFFFFVWNKGPRKETAQHRPALQGTEYFFFLFPVL